MKNTLAAVAVSVFVMSPSPAAQDARQVSVTLKAAQAAEAIEQDLRKAIVLYERAAKEAGADKVLVPQILLLLAQAQAKTGRVPDARATYARIIREYPNAGEVTTAARIGLKDGSGITNSPPRGETAALSKYQMFEGSSSTSSGGNLTWVLSPDGRQVVQGTPQGLTLGETPGGSPRILVPSEPGLSPLRGMIWSPDGRRIAYVRRTDAGSEVRSVDISTGTSRTEIDSSLLPGLITLRRWAAKAGIVLTSGARQVKVHAAGGSSPRSYDFPESAEFGDVSPDGSRIVLVGRERLVSWNPLTNDRHELTHGFEVSDPRISIDGRLIAYLSKESGSWALRVATLTDSPISGSVPVTNLPAAAPQDHHIQWTATGRLTLDARITTVGLYSLRLGPNGGPSDGRLERLVHDGWSSSNPIISPDNRRVAYQGSIGVSVMNADGSGERQLGVTGLPLGWASSDEVVIDGLDGRGPSVIDLRTATLQSTGHRLSFGAADYAGAGKVAQYISDRNEFVLKHASLDGAKFMSHDVSGRARLFLDFMMPLDSAGTREPLAFWTVSPLADRLAYVTGRRKTAEEFYKLRLRKVGEEEDVIIGDIYGPNSVTWTGDSKRLVYLARGPLNLPEFRTFDVETGQSTPVLEPKNITGVFPRDSGWVAPCVLATDWSFLACQAQVTQVHRFAWEGVTYEAVSKASKAK